MSTTKSDGGPAFPRTVNIQATDALAALEGYGEFDQGMSLRDYFAAAALTGALANPSEGVLRSYIEEGARRGHANIGETLTEAAYLYADAMLKARLSEKQD